MNQDEQALWGSHLPALMTCVAVTDGPVCEVGVGNFSTPLLHTVCVSQGRHLVSLESDEAWMDRFVRYESEHHHFWKMENLDPYPIRRWSVVFLDQHRHAWTRADSFKVFIGNADFIVCHDYHRENEEEMRSLLVGLNYHITRHQEPPTLIASKTCTIPNVLLDL